MSKKYIIEQVADARCACGENPLWDAERQVLYWTDILTGRLFRYDPRQGNYEQIYQGATVGGFTLQEDGKLLLFRDHDIALRHDDGTIAVLAQNIDPATGRFNDVIADPVGRIFAGTISYSGDIFNDLSGGLYRVDPGGSITGLFSGTGCSNGMGFSPDQQYFYWTDSTARTIFVFDYTRASGEISNRRALIVSNEGATVPDGLAIDAEGGLWSAHCFGGKIARYSPQGRLLETIEFPEPDVTSLTFGGAGLNQLYVTTAKGSDNLKRGALYRVQVDVRGRAEFYSSSSLLPLAGS